ncbi:MAG: AgmX/PglI C-terminal domain-containing protein [Myxococcales bacterium]|nr:AgmX/PglI C-terminal domain-containing protein [Myxococcales bacterium]
MSLRLHTVVDSVGSLDLSYMVWQLESYERDLHQCYQRVLADQFVAGWVAFEVQVTSQGEAELSLFETNELGESFEACVDEHMRAWGFRGIDHPMTLRLTYVFSVPWSEADSRSTEVSARRRRKYEFLPTRITDRETRLDGPGELDVDNLDRRLSRYNGEIQRCYERVLPDHPGLQGRIEVQFTIGSSGRVEDAELRRNELNEEVARCIEGRVRRWRFDAPEGGSVTVRREYLLTNSSS